jgi:hypothetical protein
MEKRIIKFKVTDQEIVRTDGNAVLASDTIGYVRAEFDIDDTWSECEEIRALWSTPLMTVPMVLDEDHGCDIPAEVMQRKGPVYVNLAGTWTDTDSQMHRLTTFMIPAVTIAEDVPVDGQTRPVSPTQFEQFIGIVRDLVAIITGMSAAAEQLDAGEAPTATYEDGVLTFGIPKGDTGDEGPQGPKGEAGDGNVTITGWSPVTSGGVAIGTKFNFTFPGEDTTISDIFYSKNAIDGFLAQAAASLAAVALSGMGEDMSVSQETAQYLNDCALDTRSSNLAEILMQIGDWADGLNNIIYSGSYNDLRDTPTAADIGAIPMPYNPQSGDVLVWNGTEWIADRP